jgi:acetolactate synthase I/II/III large subunit
LLEELKKHGVDVVFGYPGGSIMPVYDALYDTPGLRHVLVRHEQGAAHAAEGYARTSGKVGICLVTSGPGATNLVTGIADAMADSVPIICIAGQVASPYLGTGAFQEVSLMGMVTPITKWCHQITSAADIPGAVAQAFRSAHEGRHGPVVLDITRDAQVEVVEYDPSTPIAPSRSHRQAPPLDREKLSVAAQLLNEAKRPFMLVGHGVLMAGAQDALRACVEKANIPAAHTLLGLSALPAGHRLNRGMLGMHGAYSANKLTNQADVILAVGMRFDDRVTGKLSSYAKQATIIHIDIDPTELNKNVPTHLAIQADAKEALIQLEPMLRSAAHIDWIAAFEALDKEEYAQVIAPEVAPKTGPITMGEVIRQLSDETRGGALVVADVGQHQMITARYYGFAQPDSFVTSGGLGTMGFALPAAIGAKCARPERVVVAVSGDGSFQMNIQELGTIAQEKLPLKMIILNNGHLGMVRQHQEMFFGKRYSQVEMLSPDFVAVAAAYGIRGAVVSKRGDLVPAVRAMLAAKSAYVLEVCVKKAFNVLPMVPGGAAVDEVRLA